MKKTGKIEIAILAGGWSGERDISIGSGKAVHGALDPEKYNVVWYDPLHDLQSLIRDRENIDLAFILLHGKSGEDGRIQGFLDIMKIPYVGSGVLASALSFHKRIAKDLYRRAGLNVIDDIMLSRGEHFSVDRIIEAIGPLTVVKPVAEGSSLGVSICRSREELLNAIELAFQYDREIMVECYMDGREVTCCVIGNEELETLPLVEIVPEKGHVFFDYEAKYIPGMTDEICPANLPDYMKSEVEDCGKRAHQALKCRVWSRTDMIIKDERVFVLETNTVPGMTENSLVPLAARAAGMTLSQLLDRLIALSLQNKRRS